MNLPRGLGAGPLLPPRPIKKINYVSTKGRLDLELSNKPQEVLPDICAPNVSIKFPAGSTLEEINKVIIQHRLESMAGEHKYLIAKSLGIDRKTLDNAIKRHDLKFIEVDWRIDSQSKRSHKVEEED